MSLVKCAECNHEISDLAVHCVNCGHPIAKNKMNAEISSNLWSAVTKTKTPINVFALAMMTCAAVLGVSSTGVDNDFALKAFTYSLHIFLSVSGMFFATILFCRKGLYHPEDLATAKRAGVDDLGNDNPIVAAIIICLMILAYGGYQIYSVNY